MVKLFQKLADSKGKDFGRCLQRNGGVGRQPPPNHRSKEFFVKLFPKKVWAAGSRLMKFPVNHNGRPMLATTKIIHRTHIILPIDCSEWKFIYFLNEYGCTVNYSPINLFNIVCLYNPDSTRNSLRHIRRRHF